MTTLATVILYIEGPIQQDKFSNLFDAFWFVATTLSTAGFGDLYPISPLGRSIIIVTYFIGVILFPLPSTILGARLTADMAAKTQEKGSIAQVQLICNGVTTMYAPEQFIVFTDTSGNSIVRIESD